MSDLSRLRGAPVGASGLEPMELVRELFPLCRSITGDGLRATLRAAGRELPMRVHEVPTGTRVLDWEVPREWNVRGAHLTGPDGRRVVDFDDHNLHLVNYSVPVRARMRLEDLKPHLFSLPEHPDWIPYRTAYYREDWGFCLRDRDLRSLADGEYEVVVDSSLERGHLSYGEVLLEGEREDEILLTTHACHPSMANDNLSGVAVLAALGRALSDVRRRHTFRLLFLPGTIGAITWLARNRETVGRVRHGLVLAGLGDPGGFTYKRSRRGRARVDRVVERVLRRLGDSYRIVDFSPYGYDERQFCSPGFDLPVGRFSRSEYASYPQYHTSADDLGFVEPAALERSWQVLVEILAALESEEVYRSTEPFGEPQLGRRALYDELGTGEAGQRARLAVLWALNLADGEHSFEDLVERSGLDATAVRSAVDALVHVGLLERRG